MKTTLRQNVTGADRQWFVINAQGQTLGKVAVQAATYLRGRHRVDYTPHVDGGDYVVILNAEKVNLSRNKELTKMYYNHSRYLGNLKVRSAKWIRENNPTRLLKDAVNGMLAKTKHRPYQMTRLKLVLGDNNPYAAQKPETLTITE